MELRADAVPVTAENFRCLCTGEKGVGQRSGKSLHFKGCQFHRIIPGFVAQGGDFTRNNGTGGESIYGTRCFADENFTLPHAPMSLSMANAGPDTNSSQFFIVFSQQACGHLNGKHVVFGKVISGLDVVNAMEQVGSDSGKTRVPVVISDSGQLR